MNITAENMLELKQIKNMWSLKILLYYYNKIKQIKALMFSHKLSTTKF